MFLGPKERKCRATGRLTTERNGKLLEPMILYDRRYTDQTRPSRRSGDSFDVHIIQGHSPDAVKVIETADVKTTITLSCSDENE